MKRHIVSMFSVCLIGAASTAISCVTADEPSPTSPLDVWVRVSENTYKNVHADGSVSVRWFGDQAEAAQAVVLSGKSTSRELVDSVVRDSDASSSAAADQDLRVVAMGLDECGVDYTFSHSTSIFVVSAASLRVTAQSSTPKTLLGPAPVVAWVDHFDSGMITPSATSGNPTPVTVVTQLRQTPGHLGEPVTAIASWEDATHFPDSTLCSATAFSSITVQIQGAGQCHVAHGTNFACQTVR